MITVVGLDLSLTKSGVTIVREDGKVLYSGIIKSKPNGDKPIDEAMRIKKIAEEILKKIDEIPPKANPEMVIIENLSFMARNSTALTQLAGLSYLIRVSLVELGIPFCLVAPLTLKKFITGKGSGDKNLMLMSIYKNYNFEAMDDNVGDSYGLSMIGLSLLGRPFKKTGKAQQEVIDLLNRQL